MLCCHIGTPAFNPWLASPDAENTRRVLDWAYSPKFILRSCLRILFSVHQLHCKSTRSMASERTDLTVALCSVSPLPALPLCSARPVSIAAALPADLKSATMRGKL